MKQLATFFLVTTLIYMGFFIAKLIGNRTKPEIDRDGDPDIDWELLRNSPYDLCEGCKTMLLEFEKKQGFCSTCGQTHNLN